MKVAVRTVESGVSAEALIARAEALVPTLLERAVRTDTDRRICDETVSDLRAAGLFRVEQPVEYGGFGLSSIDRMQISRTLARGCGSTGWVHAVLASHAALIARFPANVRDAVWGANGEALVASAYAPTGKIVAEKDGYRLSGRFPFSSGCQLADWAGVGARAIDEGGAPKMALVPLEKLTIIDDWHTLGLRGTGSKSLQAEDVFVPAEFVMQAVKIDQTTSPLTLCAVAVGIGEGAIDRFVDHTVDRVSPVTGLKASDSEIVQGLVAESSAEIDAAWLIIEHAIRHYGRMLVAGEPLTDLDKARLRRDQAYIGRLVSRAVDRLYSACGGSGAYDKTPLQRVFRDAQTATLHPSMSWEVAAAQAGRVLLKSDYVSLF